NPVVRELGRYAGKKIPSVGSTINAVSEAKTAAAQAEINDPTAVPYSFQCPKCRTSHNFSAKDLTLIGERGGRWVCDGTMNGQPCGEIFQLRSPTGGGA